PSAELKDLKPAQQWARWKRAVQERSCRLLLVRMGSADSRQSFFSNLANLSTRLTQQGWRISFPNPRLTWTGPNWLQRQLAPWLALLVVCITPVMALRWGQERQPSWRRVFLRVVAGSLVGALLAAAIAGNPWT